MARPKRTSYNPQSLVLMGIPKKFTKYTLEDFKTYDDDGLLIIKEFCEDYVDNLVDNVDNGRGILFCGSNGVGKSMLASIILKEAYIHRYSGRRVTFSRYINEYTSSWNKHGDEVDELEQQVFEVYKGTEFLVLEEIGKEIDSKIAKPILEDLLRYREEQSLPTIICSNMSPSDIEKDYGASIMSIIKGSMEYLKVVGKDRRK